MADIRFYHLITQTFEEALPIILAKGLSAGKRATVGFVDQQDVAKFDDLLWTYKASSFLVHGTDQDRDKAYHPVLLSTTTENLNKSDMLVLCNIQTVPENIEHFTLVCDFLNGQDNNSISQGRLRYKAYKDLGHTITYWQQTDSGGWEQNA